MKNKQIDLNLIQRILVVKLRHHGDVLLTSPVFYNLKKQLPHAQVDALIYEETLPMLAHHPDIDNILTIHRQWKKNKKEQIQKEWALFQNLKNRKYNLIIHLTNHWRLFWLIRLLKPNYSVGVNLPQRLFWNKTFTHLYVEHGSKRHMVEKNLDALRVLNFSIFNKNLILNIPIEAQNKIENQLKEWNILKKEYILIHPTSRWFFKCWQEEKVAKIIQLCQKENLPVVLTSSPDEKEKNYIQKILSYLNHNQQNVFVLSGVLNLKELGALIFNAKLFLGVDSAPMHMACALNTPQVVLFGPSGNLEWGPFMAKNKYIVLSKNEEFPCRPCGDDGCGGSKMSDCLNAISVEETWQAMQYVLNQNQ